MISTRTIWFSNNVSPHGHLSFPVISSSTAASRPATTLLTRNCSRDFTRSLHATHQSCTKYHAKPYKGTPITLVWLERARAPLHSAKYLLRVGQKTRLSSSVSGCPRQQHAVERWWYARRSFEAMTVISGCIRTRNELRRRVWRRS